VIYALNLPVCLYKLIRARFCIVLVRPTKHGLWRQEGKLQIDAPPSPVENFWLRHRSVFG